MRVDDIMTRRPLTVGPGTPRADVRDLLADARIHHMPILDGDQLVGLWIGHGDGTIALLGPEKVAVLDEHEDAAEAVSAILRGQAAVIATSDGSPTGMITAEDVQRLAVAALTHDLDRRAHGPVVVRFVGPEGSGKTTLLLRTIASLQECAIGMVRPGAVTGTSEGPRIIDGAPVIEDASADRMSGLRRAITALGPVRVVFLEDRAGTRRPRWGLGESLLIAVAEPHDVARLADDLFEECNALVVVRRDSSRAASDAAEYAEARRAALPIFVVDAEGDPESLRPWSRWLRSRVLPEAVRRA